MNHSYQKQSGVTLIIVLIVLILIALLGTTSIKSATLSEKMAGNLHNQQVLFQAAEQALHFCEQTVLAFAKNPERYQLDPAPIEADENTNNFAVESNWADDLKTSEVVGIKDSLHLAREPRCMVELINDRSQLPETLRSFEEKSLIYPYRITVRAYGTAQTDSVISLQSYLRI